MENVAIVYKTNHNHEHSSKEIVGVFTDGIKLRDTLLNIIKKDINDNHEEYQSKDDIQTAIQWNFIFLMEKSQTQGLNEFELVIEYYKPNTID